MYTPNVAAGKAWYSQVLGIQPYFDEAFYVGFNVDGFELGLLPIPAALACLLELGATERSAVQDVGDGICLAIVFDPFGNVLGVIENPHFGK